MSLKEKVVTYVDETKIELQKVAWPSKEEVKGSTIIVIVTSIILGAFVGGVDQLLSRLITWLLK